MNRLCAKVEKLEERNGNNGKSIIYLMNPVPVEVEKAEATGAIAYSWHLHEGVEP